MAEQKGATPNPDLSDPPRIFPESTNRRPPHLVEHKDRRAGRHRRRVVNKKDSAQATIDELVAEEEAAVL